MNPAIVAIATLIGCSLLGCTSQPAGTTYQQSIDRVETALTAKVDKGIFPFTKESTETQTTFRFIEGSRMEKVDHATPLKVVVTITSLNDGQESQLEVEAHEHGLKLKRRDSDAEERWKRELTSAIATE